MLLFVLRFGVTMNQPSYGKGRMDRLATSPPPSPALLITLRSRAPLSPAPHLIPPPLYFWLSIIQRTRLLRFTSDSFPITRLLGARDNQVIIALMQKMCVLRHVLLSLRAQNAGQEH